MKIKYSSANGKFETDIEGEGSLAIFEGISKFQEVFEADTCGKCGCTDIKYVVRNSKDGDGNPTKYYELHCNNPKCRARLAFGVNRDMKTIYPKRALPQKDAKGKKTGEYDYLPDGGWLKYNRETGENE